MTRTQWQDLIRPSFSTYVLCGVIALLVWLDFAHWDNVCAFESSSFLFGHISPWLSEHPVLSRIADMGVVLGIAYLILSMNERFSFVRIRTMLPSLCAIVFYGFMLYPHSFSEESVITLLLFASINAALKCTVDEPYSHTFNIGLLLGIATLICPVCFAYLLVFFYFYFNMNVLNLRTFLSTLTGAVVPLIYGCAALVYTGHELFFIKYLQSSPDFAPLLPEVSSSETIFLAVVIISTGTALIYQLLTYQNETLKPRRMFSFFIQLLLFSSLMMLFFHSGYGNLMGTTLILSGMVVGRVLSMSVSESIIALWAARIFALITLGYGVYILFMKDFV